MSDPKHEYPSRYPPGTHWATDAAWDILDRIKPGSIHADERALLAGLIAGRLAHEREAATRKPAFMSDDDKPRLTPAELAIATIIADHLLGHDIDQTLAYHMMRGLAETLAKAIVREYLLR